MTKSNKLKSVLFESNNSYSLTFHNANMALGMVVSVLQLDHITVLYQRLWSALYFDTLFLIFCHLFSDCTEVCRHLQSLPAVGDEQTVERTCLWGILQARLAVWCPFPLMFSGTVSESELCQVGVHFSPILNLCILAQNLLQQYADRNMISLNELQSGDLPKICILSPKIAHTQKVLHI